MPIKGQNRSRRADVMVVMVTRDDLFLAAVTQHAPRGQTGK